MAQIVAIHQVGGPDALSFEEMDVGPPRPGELRVRQTHCGVNFIDTYVRSGLYPRPLPFIVGQEAVGEVTAVGSGVPDFRVGDRITYMTMAGGGYASERTLPAEIAFKVPDWVDGRTAAALTTKGITAQMLLRQTFRVEPGMVMLVHAAVGGVGSILVQWGKHLGATVIGTVGSDEKALSAHNFGCDHVIVYSRENFAERVREITNGDLCDVVYDGVGKATSVGSLDCLKPLGMFVSYGNASGPVEHLSMLELARRGSLFATRPMMPDYASTPARRDRMAADFYATLKEGTVKPPPIREFALRDAAKAHRALESRAGGCFILVP